MSYHVYWHKLLKKWMVNIPYQGETIHIGYFNNKSDAIIARDEAFKNLCGKDKTPKKRTTRYAKVLKEIKENKEKVMEEQERLTKPEEIDIPH